MKHQVFDREGALLREWDDDVRVFRDYAASVTRPYTTAENADADVRLAREAESLNEASIQSKARQAIAANQTYLAIASPTNAQVVQQVNRLTRECNALLRMALRDFTADDA